MKNENTFFLKGKVYKIVDVLSGIKIVDCDVNKKHKIGTANGERKIYLPGNVDEKYRFFGNFEAPIKGFVLKDNLNKYLCAAKKEYLNPSQEYRDKAILKYEYPNLLAQINNLEEMPTFNVKKSNVTHDGLYINQASGKRSDKNWNLIGDLALPRISRLSILKLKCGEELLYYFKLSFGFDYQEEYNLDDSEIIKDIDNSKMSSTEKEAIILARIGQGSFRKKLLRESGMCPFTLINDEHLLIASHIKPWKKSNKKEKTDPKNGLILSPTFDKLFDKGYISFENDKSLIISPWLSEYNREILGIENGVIIEALPEIDKKRARYLEYHRQFVLKKLEDL